MADEKEDENMNDSEPSLEEEKGTSSALTKQEKLETAVVLKDEGNAYYKQKDYRNAMKKYHRALLYVKGLHTQHPFAGLMESDDNEMSDDLKQKVQQTESTCHNNLAACHVATGRWPKVIDYSSKVLEHQPNNAKALFRRGQAYMHLKDNDRAREDLIKANELEPTDNGIRRTLAILDKELKKVTEKEKKTYAAMFEKMSV